MQEVERISYVAAFAGELEGTGKGAFRAHVVPVSCRLPVDQVAALDALAEKAGKSRTYVLSNLMEIALEALRLEVNADTQKVIRRMQGAKVRALLEKHGEEEESH